MLSCTFFDFIWQDSPVSVTVVAMRNIFLKTILELSLTSWFMAELSDLLGEQNLHKKERKKKKLESCSYKSDAFSWVFNLVIPESNTAKSICIQKLGDVVTTLEDVEAEPDRMASISHNNPKKFSLFAFCCSTSPSTLCSTRNLFKKEN